MEKEQQAEEQRESKQEGLDRGENKPPPPGGGAEKGDSEPDREPTDED